MSLFIWIDRRTTGSVVLSSQGQAGRLSYDPEGPPMSDTTTAGQFCGRTRREFLWETGAGFTSAALAGLLSADGFFEAQASPVASAPGGAATRGAFVNPLAPRPPHFKAKA